MSDKKYYMTVLHVEVVSEYPLDDMNLREIAENMIIGDLSGKVARGSSVEITPQAAAQELIIQGSEPGFFGLDDDGNSIYD